MVAVAIIAPFLMAFRDEAEGNPLLGVLIIAASVVVLTVKLFVDAIARERSAGRPLGRWRKVRMMVDYSTVAFVIIGLSDATFLFVYILAYGVIFGHPSGIGFGGVVLGVLSAVFVASRLRRASGPKAMPAHQEDRPDGDHSPID